MRNWPPLYVERIQGGQLINGRGVLSYRNLRCDDNTRTYINICTSVFIYIKYGVDLIAYVDHPDFVSNEIFPRHILYIFI